MGSYNILSELRYRLAAMFLLVALVSMTSISAIANDSTVNINLADQATLETSL